MNRTAVPKRLSRILAARRIGPILLAIACLWSAGAAGWQWPPGWGQPPVMVAGSTLGDKLRNSSKAASAQAGVVRSAARDWQNRVGFSGYQGVYFQQDYANVYFQFQNLRSQLNVMAGLATQAGSARASNAAAELDNGLNIISELFTMLQNQASAGTLDRATVARACRALDEALGEWQRQLQRDSTRFGIIW